MVREDGRGARSAYCSERCRSAAAQAAQARYQAVHAERKRERHSAPRVCPDCGGTYRAASAMGHVPRRCEACARLRALRGGRDRKRVLQAPIEPRLCQQCGLEFTPLRRRTAKFCSSQCALRRRELGRPKVAKVPTARGALPERECDLCGVLFAPMVRHARFCSRQCGHRVRGIEKTYGLPVATYKMMLDQQRGCCASCGSEIAEGRILVDHCHATGRVRGLLCSGCNIAAGHMEKRGDEVARYLARFDFDLRELCLQ